MSSPSDTIFALSSGHPPAAIAVVRISGARARFALETMIGRVPEPRKAQFARLRDPQSGEIIDEALALWFPGPNSETGEDTAELQMHGGRAVIAAVLAALGRIDGLRLAEPGEFTRRAFENGRLDLTAVEGLADLIFAETEAQRRQAFRQARGYLGEQAEGWRTRLIEILAQVEAGIDFSDEGDVPGDLLGAARNAAAMLQHEIAAILADAVRGERLREGFVVAIAGPPNAGKSTLLNRIARREVAIVSPIPGTTRDVIEVHLDLGGYPVTLLDTAGLHHSQDPIEQEGIRRARLRAEQADLVLWMVAPEDGGRPGCDSSVTILSARLAWLIRGKADLGLWKISATRENESELQFKRTVSVSSLTDEGMNELINLISEEVRAFFHGGEPSLVTRERQRKALIETLAALERATAPSIANQEVLVAEELRLAARALGRLTGRVDVEDVLDVIFRDFCIGK